MLARAIFDDFLESRMIPELPGILPRHGRKPLEKENDMKKALLSLIVAFMALGLATEPALAHDYGHRGHYRNDSNYDHGQGGGGNALAWIAGIAVVGIAANAIAKEQQERVVVYEVPPERQCRSDFVGQTYDGRPVFRKVCWDPYSRQWYLAQ